MVRVFLLFFLISSIKEIGLTFPESLSKARQRNNGEYLILFLGQRSMAELEHLHRCDFGPDSAGSNTKIMRIVLLRIFYRMPPCLQL